MNNSVESARRTRLARRHAAERRFRAFLDAHRPSGVLIVGYAGALDPSLRVGDLVAARRALLLREPDEAAPALEHSRLDGSWELASPDPLVQSAEASGLRAIAADILTFPHIVGEPAQKKILFDKHGAGIVDMETALIARADAQAVRSIDSIGVTVGDMERSLAFYTKVLPFERAGSREESGDRYEHLYGVFGAIIFLTQMRLGSVSVRGLQGLPEIEISLKPMTAPIGLVTKPGTDTSGFCGEFEAPAAVTVMVPL